MTAFDAFCLVVAIVGFIAVLLGVVVFGLLVASDVIYKLERRRRDTWSRS